MCCEKSRWFLLFKSISAIFRFTSSKNIKIENWKLQDSQRTATRLKKSEKIQKKMLITLAMHLPEVWLNSVSVPRFPHAEEDCLFQKPLLTVTTVDDHFSLFKNWSEEELKNWEDLIKKKTTRKNWILVFSSRTQKSMFPC